MHRPFRGLFVATAGVAAVVLATGLTAQTLRGHVFEAHRQRAVGTRRDRRLLAPVPGSPQSQAVTSTRSRLGGLFLLFDYNLSRGIFLDLNGPDEPTDLGNREFLEADVWLSDRFGTKFRIIGTAVVTEDFLEEDRSDTGTDIIQTVDLVLFGEGQIRAGGFWNVPDGSRTDDPLLPVLGATGTRFLQAFDQGHLRFVARPDDDEELFLLER
ncbi:MAG: hypothetical protein HY320_00970 [Armatimonadetes bacterium]|nr:hypothetical protein [Armatimonadota bacterium]